MVFELPWEFHLVEDTTTRLDLGAERAIFEKPNLLGQHIRPLYIKGHLDGTLINCMLFDGGACITIMPWSLFEKLCHKEEELLKMNMMLSGFSGQASDAKGIISKELMIGSKTVATAFFVVDIKGRYNVLLGWDWIHANGCVPSTLHQCVIQWVGDEVEIVQADDSACIALAESPSDFQDKEVKCFTGTDLSEFDYVSVGQEGSMPASVKPMIVTQLETMGVHDVK
jgi:hypothetical protein